MATTRASTKKVNNNDRPKAQGRRVGELSNAAVAGIELKFDGLGSAEVVEIAKINVDPTYQRSIRHDLVNKIAREYDIVKAGPILVSERKDGSLWCVDGQHRMAGALQANETEIFAHVVHGLTREKEAELRLARNERKSDTTFEKFRTRLVMHDPKAEAIVELMHQQGTQLNLESNMQVGFNCLSAVEQIYDADGTGVWLERAVKFLNDCFGEEGRPLGGEAASVGMLKGVVWFIDRHIDMNEAGWAEAIQKFSKFGPGDIRRKAVNHKAALGGALWLNHYRSLVEIWNFGRQEKSKLLWKTTGAMTSIGSDNRSAEEARRVQSARGGGHQG